MFQKIIPTQKYACLKCTWYKRKENYDPYTWQCVKKFEEQMVLWYDFFLSFHFPVSEKKIIDNSS